MRSYRLLLAPFLLIATSICLSAQEKVGTLSNTLVGTWILVGTPDKVGEIPANGGRLKLITPTHWAVTQANPQNGTVLYHHGGTYSLDGEDYVENVKFANQSTASLIGNAHKFKIKIEGDTLTLTGIGNPWNEVWKRMK